MREARGGACAQARARCAWGRAHKSSSTASPARGAWTRRAPSSVSGFRDRHANLVGATVDIIALRYACSLVAQRKIDPRRGLRRAERGGDREEGVHLFVLLQDAAELHERVWILLARAMQEDVGEGIASSVALSRRNKTKCDVAEGARINA